MPQPEQIKQTIDFNLNSMENGNNKQSKQPKQPQKFLIARKISQSQTQSSNQTNQVLSSIQGYSNLKRQDSGKNSQDLNTNESQYNNQFEQSQLAQLACQFNQQNYLAQNSKILRSIQFEKSYETSFSQQGPYNVTDHNTQDIRMQSSFNHQILQQSNLSFNRQNINSQNQSSTEQKNDQQHSNEQEIQAITQNNCDQDRTIISLMQSTINNQMDANFNEYYDIFNNPILQSNNLLDFQGYNIRKQINYYYEESLLKIKQKDKNAIKNPQIIQFKYKINKQISEYEIKEIAKASFMFFNLQTDQNDLQIVRKDYSVQYIDGKHMMQWAYDNSYVKFGQCGLNQDNEKTFNGFGLVIQTGQWIYSGQIKNNKANGKGKICWADGSTYQGDYRNDKRNGKGKRSYVDGTTFQGDFRDDKIKGKGKFCLASGQNYQGYLKDDKSQRNECNIF